MMPDKTPAMNLRPMCAPCSSMDSYMDAEWGASVAANRGGGDDGSRPSSPDAVSLFDAVRSIVRRRHEAVSGLQA